MNEELKKPEKYRKRYMRSHKIITLLLDNKRDADILDWLSKQENRSEAIRNVLRNFILFERDNVEGNNEMCWLTGEYTDGCDCELCSHKSECSGYEGGEND